MKYRMCVGTTVDPEIGEALTEAARRQNITVAEFTRRVLREVLATQIKAAQEVMQRQAASESKSA